MNLTISIKSDYYYHNQILYSFKKMFKKHISEYANKLKINLKNIYVNMLIIIKMQTKN